MTIKCALLSVSDKSSIVAFARFLESKHVKILSTGETASLLKKNSILTTEIAEFTASAEILKGRVRTLHPKIHGGILAKRKLDRKEITTNSIPLIDLVVVNLYPFEQIIADPFCAFNTAIENIDIEGPAMIRAAAKNHQDVTVVVDPKDYPLIEQQFEHEDVAFRFKLAKKAFAHTAHYDAAISNYLGTLDANYQPQNFPEIYNVQFKNRHALGYGENPHQKAVLYRESLQTSGNIASAKLLQGKALSYNNIADTDLALEAVKSFSQTEHSCVIVKHANPYSIACRTTQIKACQRALATGPASSFGGIIAFNQTLEAATAQAIIEQQFIEVLIAPEISAQAREVLSTKKSLRVLASGHWQSLDFRLDYKRVNGGLLVQEYDHHALTPNDCRIVTRVKPDEAQMQDLLFAWQVVKHVKSSAIVYAQDKATVGIGAGQMGRVYSAMIAAIKARDEGLSIQNSVMASDACIPCKDAIDEAAEAGIRAIIQPGGSTRDEEIIHLADEWGIAMVFTGIRNVKH